jgi:bifunctional ADP-heptose synthase (sugar kinase/adenylyltransferase)
METVPEAIEAKKHGALVLSMPYLTGYSTSALLNRIRA